ncbi:MAG: formylglycine-generating enzyme family protein [Rhodospirillales bacterium]|nr:MAG: formylglycine-generating enzyme family protein [Rhodospirillales bacterium]
MRRKMCIRGLVLILSLFGMLGASAAQAGDPGVLRIVTEPGDAQIFIDGKRKGNSPSEAGQSFAIKLDEGRHVVEAVKPDGSTQELYAKRDDVFVADGTMQTLTLKLTDKRPNAAFVATLHAKFGGRAVEPALVLLPAGTFRMGCDGGKDCEDHEKPVHTVTIKAFEMAKTELTFDEWDACVADSGCPHLPEDNGWGRGNRPVINVSWDDVQTYLVWLNRKTGKTYRLPTESEWEYAARAGTATPYSWGNDIGKGNANCDGCGGNKQTAPVGSFRPNPFGLSDMHGNVWEWVQDCYQNNYAGAPGDGSAFEGKNSCFRVIRGGSWNDGPRYHRSANRSYVTPVFRNRDLGFRLARTLP